MTNRAVDSAVRAATSLRQRGVRSTLRTLGYKASDQLYDRRHGVRTARQEWLDSLTVPDEARSLGSHYEAVNSRGFRTALEGFDLDRELAFVDMGCGKGRALLLAAELGFRRVVGVEFAAELVAFAERNLRTAAARSGASWTWRVHHVDVREYQVADDDGTFFFNNPFSSEVMATVLEHVKASHRSKPRPVRIIYVCPHHRELLDDDPAWDLLCETVMGGGAGSETFLLYAPTAGS